MNRIHLTVNIRRAKINAIAVFNGSDGIMRTHSRMIHATASKSAYLYQSICFGFFGAERPGFIRQQRMEQCKSFSTNEEMSLSGGENWALEFRLGHPDF